MPQFYIVAIRDFPDIRNWRGSYLAPCGENLNDAIKYAIQERDSRGGKYGVVLYDPSGNEVGKVDRNMNANFQHYGEYINK